MKTTKLLILLLFIGINQFELTAQELLQEGTQWNIKARYWTFPPTTETISVKIEGDTIIDGISYKKIYESRDSLNNFWTQTNDYIRENTNDMVYLWRDNEEILLYDFNLSVGDTFPVTYNAWAECSYLVVTQIDSVELLNGEMRKRWTLENHGTPVFGLVTEWIEGLGSIHGIWRYITNQWGCWEHYPYDLLCFYENEEMVYSNPWTETCWLVSSIEELNSQEDKMQVFPNPSSENVFIKTEYSGRTIEEVKLYSTNGQLLESFDINAQETTLKINQYESGIYYLLIEDSAGILRSVKLIKH